MLEFLFGKKRKTSRKVKGKPPAKMLKMCRRLKIKATKKLGSHRVYKSQAVLKKLIAKKKKSVKRSRFGSTSGVFSNTSPEFGYNQDVRQIHGTIGQSPNYVSLKNNSDRPHNISAGGEKVDMRLGKQYIPTYGTSARFFNQSVPRIVSPEWNAMAQQDGSKTQVGWPFYGNNKEVSFGKKRILSKSACRGTRKSRCGGSNPNCTWRKKRGCVYRKGASKKGAVYQGPSLQFGKRRKSVRKVKKLPKSIVKMCRKLKIKTTVKRGSKRVQKKLSVLKKLISKKKKMMKRR